MNAIRGRALAIVAVVVVVLGTLDLTQHYGIGTAAALGLSLLRAAPIAVARFRPRLAWAGTLAATVLTAVPAERVSAAEPWPWAVTSVLAAMAVLAVLGTRERPPVLVAAWLSALAAGAGPLLAAPDRGDLWDLVPAAALTSAALAGGRLVRGRADARRSLVEQTVATESERAGREALRERARLARELHDVIAHGLSVVTVRADSAPQRVPDVSPAAAAEFAAIAEAARGSLTELRQVLGVLRDPGADAETAPLPGLAELPALVGPADLTVTGAGTVPPAVQLAAYRLVQEGLSNARRHAPGAAVTVAVTGAGTGLTVTVANAAGGPTTGPGAGYGLAGMRERVALLGGSLHAGPRPDGGWLVEAVLPGTAGPAGDGRPVLGGGRSVGSTG